MLVLVASFALVVANTLAGAALTPSANAAPCPDGSQTCGPQPTQDPGPTQGNQGAPTTAPQAPQTTIPPNGDTGAQSPPQTNGNPGFQGTVQAMPTPDNPDGCIANCQPTQAPTAAPTTAQAPPTSAGAPTTAPDPHGQTQEATSLRKKCELASSQLAAMGTVVGGSEWILPENITGGGGGRSPLWFPRDPTPPSKGVCQQCLEDAKAMALQKMYNDFSNKWVSNLKCDATSVTANGTYMKTGPGITPAQGMIMPKGGGTYSVSDSQTSVPAIWTVTAKGSLKGDLGPVEIGGEVGASRTQGYTTYGKLQNSSATLDPAKIPAGALVQAWPVYTKYHVKGYCAGVSGKGSLQPYGGEEETDVEIPVGVQFTMDVGDGSGPQPI